MLDKIGLVIGGAVIGGILTGFYIQFNPPIAEKGQEILGVNVDRLYDKLDFLLVPSSPSTAKNPTPPEPRQLSLLAGSIKDIRSIQVRISDKIEEIIERLDV